MQMETVLPSEGLTGFYRAPIYTATAFTESQLKLATNGLRFHQKWLEKAWSGLSVDAIMYTSINSVLGTARPDLCLHFTSRIRIALVTFDQFLQSVNMIHIKDLNKCYRVKRI